MTISVLPLWFAKISPFAVFGKQHLPFLVKGKGTVLRNNKIRQIPRPSERKRLNELNRRGQMKIFRACLHESVHEYLFHTLAQIHVSCGRARNHAVVNHLDRAGYVKHVGAHSARYASLSDFNDGQAVVGLGQGKHRAHPGVFRVYRQYVARHTLVESICVKIGSRGRRIKPGCVYAHVLRHAAHVPVPAVENENRIQIFVGVQHVARLACRLSLRYGHNLYQVSEPVEKADVVAPRPKGVNRKVGVNRRFVGNKLIRKRCGI